MYCLLLFVFLNCIGTNDIWHGLLSLDANAVVHAMHLANIHRRYSNIDAASTCLHAPKTSP